MKHLIVIPAFNEEEALPRTLAALDRLPPEYEVLVVNDSFCIRVTEVLADGGVEEEP